MESLLDVGDALVLGPTTDDIFASQDIDFSLLWFSLLPQDDENTGHTSCSSDSRPPRSKNSNRRQTERNRQQRYRQRLRSERESLEAEVMALSRQLEQLKQHVTAERQKMSTSALSPIESSWLTTSVLQREERMSSEEESQRLQGVVATQAGYIKHLQSLLPDKHVENEEVLNFDVVF